MPGPEYKIRIYSGNYHAISTVSLLQKAYTYMKRKRQRKVRPFFDCSHAFAQPANVMAFSPNAHLVIKLLPTRFHPQYWPQDHHRRCSMSAASQVQKDSNYGNAAPRRHACKPDKNAVLLKLYWDFTRTTSARGTRPQVNTKLLMPRGRKQGGTKSKSVLFRFLAPTVPVTVPVFDLPESGQGFKGSSHQLQPFLGGL